MRILTAGAFPFPAPLGSQTYALGCANALARRGHEVTFVSLAGGSTLASPQIRLIRAPRVPGAAFAHSGPHWSRVPGSLLLVRSLTRLLDRPWDVIAAHNVDAPVLAWLAERIGGRRVPIVRHVHARMEHELGDWFPDKAWLTRRIGLAADRLSARVADRQLAISADTHRWLIEQGYDARYAPPGIDVADLDGADPERVRRLWGLDGRPWVAYVGNTDRYQELPVLIEAVGRLAGVGLLLVVNGEPPDVSSLGERVRLIRSASFADHRDGLAAATVGAIPRSVCAGFPIKLLNYLGMGLPTVCAAGSAQDIDGVRVAPDRDPAGFADMLQRLISDPELPKLRQAARTAIREQWTWDVRGAELEDAYRF